MRPCVEGDWVLLGDNYTEEYKSNSLSSFYCPDISGNFTLRDTFRSNTPDYVSISLYPCDNTVVPTCNTSKII